MAAERKFVLPGDPIDPAAVPRHKNRPLRLGPGIRLNPPSELLPTRAGELVTDAKKNTIWVDHPGGKYLPTTGDLVIGTIRGGTADFYYVSIADHSTNALLPNLAFESATKKTRPILANGALVYARVSAGLDANKHMDATLECVYPSTGRADGLGPLTDGMVFGVSLGLARRLLMPRPLEDGGVAVLAELEAAGAAFETAVGRNGRVWVDAADVRTVVAVGRALTETDERRLDVDAQRRLARRIIKDLSG